MSDHREELDGLKKWASILLYLDVQTRVGELDLEDLNACTRVALYCLQQICIHPGMFKIKREEI
jgi:hypothetical protein